MLLHKVVEHRWRRHAWAAVLAAAAALIAVASAVVAIERPAPAPVHRVPRF